MTNRNIFKEILLVICMMSSYAASAADSDTSPLAVGLFPPLQLPSSGYGITGLRVSVVGVHRQSQGIDVALLGNTTTNKFSGLAVAGLYNYNSSQATVVGLQLAGLANYNSDTSSVYGMQLAAFNKAGTVYGFQLGLVNVAKELHGIQIGLFNMNKAGPFTASPIINVGF